VFLANSELGGISLAYFGKSSAHAVRPSCPRKGYVRPDPSSHLASAAVVAARLALPPSAAISVPLNSGQEPAGGEGEGHGFLSYAIDGTEFCWTLSWRGIADTLVGQVYLTPRRVAGPIVIDLGADGVGARTHPAVA
jgi:hypothetical protein